MIDYQLLKEKIISSGLKMCEIARLLGISRASLWRKINGKTEFKSSELVTLFEVLKISKLSEILN